MRETRVVTDHGWPCKYRAHIVRHDGWIRHGWKVVIERKWVHWSHHLTLLRVHKTEALAREAANAWLDAHDRYLTRKDYVPASPSRERSGNG